MALSQSALREVLDALTAGESVDMIRDAVQVILHHRVRRLPARALEEDLVDQPARAGEQGDQTPHRRRRSLPEPLSAATPGRQRPDREPRRVAGLRPTLPLRELDGPDRRRHHRLDQEVAVPELMAS